MILFNDITVLFSPRPYLQILWHQYSSLAMAYTISMGSTSNYSISSWNACGTGFELLGASKAQILQQLFFSLQLLHAHFFARRAGHIGHINSFHNSLVRLGDDPFMISTIFSFVREFHSIFSFVDVTLERGPSSDNKRSFLMSVKHA